MSLLLDTHVLIWLAEGLPELSKPARQHIDKAAATDGVAVSAISFWEIAMLHAKGRLSLSRPIRDWHAMVAAVRGLAEVAVSSEIAIEAGSLPGPFHGDPADRLIVATARTRGWPLMTRDARILAYGEAGHARVAAV